MAKKFNINVDQFIEDYEALIPRHLEYSHKAIKRIKKSLNERKGLTKLEMKFLALLNQESKFNLTEIEELITDGGPLTPRPSSPNKDMFWKIYFSSKEAKSLSRTRFKEIWGNKKINSFTQRK